MASYLEARGVDAKRIAIEDASRNTVENIANSRGLIDPENDRVGIVTNDFHLFRSLGIAKDSLSGNL